MKFFFFKTWLYLKNDEKNTLNVSLSIYKAHWCQGLKLCTKSLLRGSVQALTSHAGHHLLHQLTKGLLAIVATWFHEKKKIISFLNFIKKFEIFWPSMGGLTTWCWWCCWRSWISCCCGCRRCTWRTCGGRGCS